jgi:hypothetical protein
MICRRSFVDKKSGDLTLAQVLDFWRRTRRHQSKYQTPSGFPTSNRQTDLTASTIRPIKPVFFIIVLKPHQASFIRTPRTVHWFLSSSSLPYNISCKNRAKSLVYAPSRKNNYRHFRQGVSPGTFTGPAKLLSKWVKISFRPFDPIAAIISLEILTCKFRLHI